MLFLLDAFFPSSVTQKLGFSLRTKIETPCTIRVPLTKRDETGRPDIKGFFNTE
jgi:hypothetical protein